MKVLIIISILFVAVAARNFSIGAYSEAAAGAGVAVVLGLFAMNLHRRNRKLADFLVWLDQIREDIKRGPVLYEGVMVTGETRIRQYEYCVSLLIVTTIEESPYMVEGRHNHISTGIIYSLITLLGGWWGFPWGPVNTIKVLYRNARGGYVFTIAEMVDDMETLEMLEESENDLE